MAIIDNITDLYNAMRPLILSDVATTVVQTGSSASSSSVSSGAPVDGQYLVLAVNGTLTNERAFTLAVNSGMSGTDGGAGGNYTLALGTPSTLTVSSTNAVTGSNHTHAITSSSSPGAAASILASDASGILTLPQFTATTKVRTPTIDTASGSLTFSPASDVVMTPGSTLVKLSSGVALQSSNYASQTTGMRVTYAGEGDFRYLFTDELHAKSFIADLEQALAGGQIIAKSVAMLYSAFTMPASGSSGTFVVRDLPSATGMRVFEDRDIVRFRSFSRSGGALTITDAWGEVTLDTSYGTSGFDSLTKTQRYTYLRRASVTIDDQNDETITDSTSDPILSSNITTPEGSMSGGTVIAADSIVLDYGKNSSGIHEINAIDGTYGTNSPYAQTISWQIHPKNSTVRTRIGNLRGIFGVDNEFGIFAGTGTSTSDQYFKASSEGVSLANVPLALYRNGSQRVNIDADGVDVWFSSNGGTTKQFAWNGSSLTLNDASLNLTGTGLITLAGTGGTVVSASGILGTDSGGKPTFSLINTAQTVNGEALGAGDTLLGDNSSSKGNVLFDQSAGTLIIRTGTTNVLSFGSSGSIEGVMALGTSGEIRQGSGTVGSNFTGMRIRRSGSDGWIELYDNDDYTLSLTPSNALTIVGGTAYAGSRAISFVDTPGNYLGNVYGYTDGSTYNAMRFNSYSNSSSKASYAYLDSMIEAASGSAVTQVRASKFTSPSSYPYPTAVIENTADLATPLAKVQLFVRSKTSGSSGATATLTDNNGTTTFTVVAGSKSWRIDHPLRPTTHWLDHVTVEGHEHYTFYRGNVVLDDTGHATVQMPDWFDALNDDLAISYGEWGAGKGMRPHTLHRIPNGWVIAGKPRAKVSWIATGLRADAWAKAHPVQAEPKKDDADQGTVFAWQEHGLDESFAPPEPNQQPAGQ